MRLTSVLLVLVSFAITATALADFRRGVPRELREALLGCWEPWPGERWEISEQGATGLRLETRFDERLIRDRFAVRSRPRRYSETVLYRTEDAALQVPCGPTTQHGQFCMLSFSEGELHVALYSRGHGRRHRTGTLREVVVARRCGTRP